MTKQEKLSILITFTVGFFAGIYLYVAGFATTFELPALSTDDVYAGFVIEGEGYGACETDNTCLSFQLLESGAYRGLYDATDGEVVVKEGVIPRALRRELLDALLPAQMAIESQPNLGTCRFPENETNYRFEVTREGREYVLDTCTSALNYNAEIWTTLAKLWNYLATIEL